MSPHDRRVMGTAFPSSQLRAWFPHTSARKIGSLVLPSQGEGPAFLSVAPGSW